VPAWKPKGDGEMQVIPALLYEQKVKSPNPSITRTKTLAKEKKTEDSLNWKKPKQNSSPILKTKKTSSGMEDGWPVWAGMNKP
jgi:hypothetical protein